MATIRVEQPDPANNPTVQLEYDSNGVYALVDDTTFRCKLFTSRPTQAEIDHFIKRNREELEQWNVYQNG